MCRKIRPEDDGTFRAAAAMIDHLNDLVDQWCSAERTPKGKAPSLRAPDLEAIWAAQEYWGSQWRRRKLGID